MYAFLSSQSACEALRHLGKDAPNQSLWPHVARPLPRYGDCVSTQASFKAFSSENDFESLGVLETPVHLLVPSAGSRSRGRRAAFHVWQREIPPCAMLRISERVFASHPKFVLAQMAMQGGKAEPIIEKFVERHRADQMASPDGQAAYDDPFEWARIERLVHMALVACEFAGSYRLAGADGGTSYRMPALMTREEAKDFANALPRHCRAKTICAALDLAFDRSASPMESALALMLTLPAKMGGYGLPKPELNVALPTGDWGALWDGGATVTPDLLWVQARLAVEYESNEFHEARGPQKATSDAARANVLSGMGYTVLRATTGTITSLAKLGQLANQIAAQLRIAPATEDDVVIIRRHRLHALLMHHGRTSRVD